jgi:hypothetical protein
MKLTRPSWSFEVLRDQRDRRPVSQQQPLARREHELGKPKSDGRSHEASSLSEEQRAARMPFGGAAPGHCSNLCLRLIARLKRVLKKPDV